MTSGGGVKMQNVIPDWFLWVRVQAWVGRSKGLHTSAFEMQHGCRREKERGTGEKGVKVVRSIRIMCPEARTWHGTVYKGLFVWTYMQVGMNQ